jgi:phenylpropionate dioxygenase-like ring-hydroxylating dioxygenase large terminal subunit
VERDELIDLTRRALELARDKTTDLAAAEHTVPASDYTSAERHERDVAMLAASPQLVGYAAELPEPGSYCTKSVLGRQILMTRSSGGSVKAFHNVCLHRQSVVATGCGSARRLACRYHAWTYDLDGKLVGVPGREGFPEIAGPAAGLAELPAAEFAGFLWLSLDPTAHLDVAAHLGPLAGELQSWELHGWAPVGERTLDTPINWKLAVDTFAENYHFATVHSSSFGTFSRSNCAVFDSFGPHHRLVFPLKSIVELDEIPEAEWQPLRYVSIIYGLFPNIVISVTPGNGELFRVYPATAADQSITVHQNATRLNMSDEKVAASARAAFEFAHGAVRDEDYALVTQLQANLAAGVRESLAFGRNEPALAHRHTTWRAAIEARAG